MKKSTVRILKITAAQRQLDAAIRMTFAEEDPLAIATVAAAARRLFADIKEKRGSNVLVGHPFTTAGRIARGEHWPGWQVRLRYQLARLGRSKRHIGPILIELPTS